MESSRQSPVDPFTLKPNFSVLQLLKVAINAVWLLPLRLLFIILPSMITGFTITFIIACCYRQCEPPEPMRGWRRWLKDKVLPWIDRWLLFGLGFQYIEVKGYLRSSAEVPILIVAPHSTILDTFFMSMFTLASAVVKEEARHIPLFGRSAHLLLQLIFVRRGEQESRDYTVREIRRRAESKGDWPHVLVYPEGTTTNAKCVITYKRGAFVPGLPIQQVLFRHTNRHNTIVWAERGVGVVLTLFLSLCQFHNKLAIEFLPPYYPSEEEVADPLLYARNMQERAADHLGVPATKHSYEDVRLLNTAQRLGLPYTTGIVEFDWLKNQTKFTFDEVRLLLERYCHMNVGRNNHLTALEMASHLNIDPEVSTKLHNMLQSESFQGDDGLSFSRYVLGLGKVAKLLASSEQFTTELFQTLDHTGKGFVTLGDIHQSSLPWSPRHLDDMNYNQFRQFLLSNLEYVALAKITSTEQQ